MTEPEDHRKQLARRVQHDFTTHPPTEKYIDEAMSDVRAKAMAFAFECIDKCTCPSRELSLALTKIEEAAFYAIAAIARYQPDDLEITMTRTASGVEVRVEGELGKEKGPPEQRCGEITPEPWEGNGPCMDCGGRSPYWHAPNDLWQDVMSRPGSDPHDPGGLICPVCFIARHYAKHPDEEKVWWTLTPIPAEFLPRGDFDWAIDRRNAVLVERDRARSALTTARDFIKFHPAGHDEWPMVLNVIEIALALGGDD